MQKISAASPFTPRTSRPHNVLCVSRTGALRALRSTLPLLRTTESAIQDCFEYVQKDKKVMVISLTYEQRTNYLPQVLRDLLQRLRSFKSMGTHAGVLRCCRTRPEPAQTGLYLLYLRHAGGRVAYVSHVAEESSTHRFQHIAIAEQRAVLSPIIRSMRYPDGRQATPGRATHSNRLSMS
jgi:hypothetical protein